MKGVNLINPSELNIDQEDLQFFFELKGFRRNRSLLVENNVGEAALEVRGGGEINFNAFDQDANAFTTKYTNIDLEEPTVENFGIKSISIKMTPNFVYYVNVTFVDTRGRSLLTQGDDSPLALLFDLPLPFFEMVVKGYYGKALKSRLILSQPAQITHKSETGDYEISASLTSYTFGIFRDLNMSYLLSAPFMRNELNDTTSTSTYPRKFQC